MDRCVGIYKLRLYKFNVKRLFYFWQCALERYNRIYAFFRKAVQLYFLIQTA